MASRVTQSDRVDALFPDSTIAELRQMTEGNMLHRATVTMAPTTGTRVGGALVNTTPTTLYTDEPCRLTPSRRLAHDAIGAGDQLRAVKRWSISFASSVDIPEGAVALVSGEVDGVAWSRRVRIVSPEGSQTFVISSGYSAVDVSPGGR